MIFAKVFNDVLLQFVGFGDQESLAGYQAAYPDCQLLPVADFGSPMTHWVVDGAVVPVPAPPTPTSQWVPAARAYVDLYDVGTARAAARARVNQGYTLATASISAGYPPAERESWPVQTSEARLMQLDPQAFTPWIDSAAQARGLGRLELAARILALDNTYRSTHGHLSGVRQRLEGQINSTTDLTSLEAIAWPSSPVSLNATAESETL